MKFAIAIEDAGKKHAYGMVVPDLLGCFSAGDTIDEAFDNARDAIEIYCEMLVEKGEGMPELKSLAEWQKNRQYRGWTWGIVDVPVEKFFGPAEKINITVPARILRRIDNYAAKRGETRSGFFVRVAEDAMRKGRDAPLMRSRPDTLALR